MAPKLTVDRRDEEKHTFLAFKGIIDEEANFKDAFTGLKPNVIINLEGIQMINSCGVREWIHGMEEIPASAKVELDKCATRIVEQFNYVVNFRGSGEVTSFFAPYFCPKCKAEETILLTVKDLGTKRPVKAPPQKCPTCKGPMEFDDIEEEYFSFLA